jgi:hypothetical protein
MENDLKRMAVFGFPSGVENKTGNSLIGHSCPVVPLES